MAEPNHPDSSDVAPCAPSLGIAASIEGVTFDGVDAQGAERNLDAAQHTPGDCVPDSDTGNEAKWNRAQADWQDQDGAPESEQEGRHALSRRDLFGAAGGFALSVSGLVLPDWLVKKANVVPQRSADSGRIEWVVINS